MPINASLKVAFAAERDTTSPPIGEIRPPVTMALLGMLNFTFAWLRPDGPMSYEAFGELALELSLNGLGAGERLAPMT